MAMKDSTVRPYTRSNEPRMRWTNNNHRRFVIVVNSLGGVRKATPKKILMSMGMKDLTISQVKSHLQLYRNMKEGKSIKARRMMKKRQTQDNLQIYENENRDKAVANKAANGEEELSLELTLGLKY